MIMNSSSFVTIIVIFYICDYKLQGLGESSPYQTEKLMYNLLLYRLGIFYYCVLQGTLYIQGGCPTLQIRHECYLLNVVQSYIPK